MGRRGRRRGRGGYLLLENMLVVFIMTAAALGFIAMMQASMAAVFKARENAACSRAAQTAFARLRNIDYYSVFALDSSAADYGLWAAYPYKAVLDGVRSTLANARFDRFRVTVAFMRRDSSDADADGAFSGGLIFVTAGLSEGYNTLSAQAVKDSYSSPTTSRLLLVDRTPPGAGAAAPTGAVATRHPEVAVTLSDASPSTTGADLIVVGVYFVEQGTSNMSMSGSANKKFWLYGVRTQGISISPASSFSGGRNLAYDANLRAYPPPGLPEKPLLVNWRAP